MLLLGMTLCCRKIFKDRAVARIVGILTVLCVGAGLTYVYGNRYTLLQKHAPILFVTDSSVIPRVDQRHDTHTSRDTTTKETEPRHKTQPTRNTAKKTTKKSTSGMPEYLPDYKNPCWYVGPPSAKNLRCIPYFHMPGFAKSGTSTLCNCWIYHPEIGVPKHKEIYFWKSPKSIKQITQKYPLKLTSASREIYSYTNKSSGFDRFHPKITYDCTPSNAWHHYLPNTLATIFKKTRVIVLMRHPTDRTFSAYHFFCVRRYKSQHCTGRNFDKIARKGVKQFQSCMARHSSVVKCVSSAKGPVADSVYIGYIKRWLKNIPRSQMLFIKAEDMYNRTVDVMDEAFHFLGMAPADENVKEKISYCMNNRRYPGMNKVTKGHVAKIPQTEKDVSRMKEAKEKWGEYRDTMLPKTRKLLDDFFAPYNRMLADAVQDERFLFDDVRKV